MSEMCTSFTTEHRLVNPVESDVFAAAICPSCANPNPLTGEPAAFFEQTIRCMRCTSVMVLDETALKQFIAEELAHSRCDQSEIG